MKGLGWWLRLIGVLYFAVAATGNWSNRDWWGLAWCVAAMLFLLLFDFQSPRSQGAPTTDPNAG